MNVIHWQNDEGSGEMDSGCYIQEIQLCSYKCYNGVVIDGYQILMKCLILKNNDKIKLLERKN